MDEEKIQARINYFLREKYYRNVQASAKDGLKKLGNDPTMHFWSTFGLLMEEKYPDALKDLNKIVENKDVSLPVFLALIHAQKAAGGDKDAIAELETKVKNEVKSCGEVPLYHAALFLAATGKLDKARELSEKLTKLAPEAVNSHLLRGWIDLQSGREMNVKRSLKSFDDAIKAAEGAGQPAPLDAIFGKIRFYQTQRVEYNKCADLVNAMVASHAGYLPAIIEKTYILVGLGDWDGALDSAERCLALDAACVPALHTQALYSLVRVGNYQEASKRLGSVVAALEQSEPRNHWLFYSLSLAPSRLSARHPLVLQQTRLMLDKAITLSPQNALYLTESAYHLVMTSQEKDALKVYQSAMALDESSVAALNGIINCQLLENQLDEAAQQLEFLTEIQQSIGKSPELCYLSALLASKRSEPLEKVVGHLDEALAGHVKALQEAPFGDAFYQALNPDLLLQIAKLYLQYCRTDPDNSTASSPLVLKTLTLLETLAKHCPGQLEGVYLLAKTKYIAGDIDAAMSGAQYCLQQDATFVDAHLLMAQIHVAQGNTSAAASSLQVGLSYNFEVRESPVYYLISARIQEAEGKFEETIKTLLQAMKLPGVRKTAGVPKKKGKKPFTVSDRASVFLELARAYWKLDQPNEAAKVIQDALSEFAGTPDELRILIANAELSVSRGDFDGALNILRAITPQQPYYVHAREKMADIYLNHRKDKRLYVACYRELAEQLPNTHTSILLGDAYMNIQEPDRAIEVYDNALKKNPKEGLLASKIGRALIRTHDFTKAINYYEAALKSGTQAGLRADLAELYLKLRHYDKAEKLLSAALDHAETNDLSILQMDVRYNMLMSKIFEEANRNQAVLVLLKAREIQGKVLQRTAVEQPEALKKEQHLASEICLQIAVFHEKNKDTHKSTDFYQEALSHDSTNAKAMIALAKLHLAVPDLEAAQYQLVSLLRNDKNNSDAMMMMADIMLRKGEYDSAIFHFQQLLEREPEHYTALARLVDLLRRAGKLPSCPKFLDQAQRACSRPEIEPGLNYCRGLYHRYTHEPNVALKHLNLARRDSEWGVQALYHMIEICLNPDNETLGGETFEASDSESMARGAKTAEKLLQELRSMSTKDNSRLLVLTAYASMASGNKASIEKAIQDFTALAAHDADAIAPVLGLARGYNMLKQQPKARAQLKRLEKAQWNSTEAEEFEGCWLLLADSYIQAGKYDVAQEFLKKCLQHNKSCSRAWEYMGHIMEKEQAFANAAEFYENAWSFCNGGDPSIGFKLSFNYLKAKRFVEAIDVCHAVLKINPQYPKIRREVLEKARMGLRN